VTARQLAVAQGRADLRGAGSELLLAGDTLF
jgi:hypothetical protein